MLRVLIVISCVLLSACGGGSSGDNTQPKVVVSAGSNQVVDEGVTVQLNGDASGQSNSFTYAWSATPKLTIVHQDTSTAAASFVAPATTTSTTYTLTLQATDAAGNRASDSISVEVKPVNQAPIAVIQDRLKDGGKLAIYPAGVEIVLDASQSSDPDAAEGKAAISAYLWQQSAGQKVIADNIDNPTISFVSPILTQQNDLGFELTVTDQEGATHSTRLTLAVLSESQTLPVVDAGVNHHVLVGENILLSGVASSSVPNAHPLQYSWRSASPLQPTIKESQKAHTYAVAPKVSSVQTATFTLLVTDQFGNQVEDSVTATIRPLPLRKLNDSGVIQQASMTTISSDNQGDYPGQDGQRGGDVIHRNGLLDKTGRGKQGFDFTRLDDIGDEVDDVSKPWTCVRDNTTGLIWEAKTTDSGPRDSRHSYTWYFLDNNGDNPGTANNTATSCTLTNCNTTEYIEHINSRGLCGFFDWRLPTHNELLSIVHYGATSAPLIDADYFPNSMTGLSAPVWYWVREANVDGVNVEEQAANAWAIDFATGNDNFLNKAIAARIRLVRAGR